MQNRKLKASPDTRVSENAELPLAIADTNTATAVPSPARGLQASLERQLEGAPVSSPSSNTIPFGWTAVGLIAFCAAFWSAVAFVLS